MKKFLQDGLNTLLGHANKAQKKLEEISENIPSNPQELLDKGKEVFNEGKKLVDSVLPAVNANKVFPTHVLTFSCKGNRVENLPSITAQIRLPLPSDEEYQKRTVLLLSEVFSELWDNQIVSVSNDQEK